MELKKFFFLVATLIGMLAFIMAETTTVKLLLLLFMNLGGMAYYKFDVLYPFNWLSLALIIYNVPIYLLDILGYRTSFSYPVILNCLFFSICVLFFYCAFFVKKVQTDSLSDGFLDETRISFIKKTVVFFALYLLLCIPLFLRSGYVSKMDMNLHGGIFGFGIVSRWLMLLYTIFIIYKYKHEDVFSTKLFVCLLVLTLLLSLFIGERDVLLSITLCSFLVYYCFNKVNIIQLLVLGIIGVVAITVLGQFRQITNQDDLGLSENDFVESVFSGEFSTSGYNFEILLENEGNWEYQEGEGLLSDVLYSFVPSSLLPIKTPSQWYNSRYNSRSSEGYGAGFSFIAEGYLQWGVWGVLIWALLLVMIVHALYVFSSKTIYGLAAYIFMINIVVYAMRGDFAYVLSPLVKQVLLSYILLQLLFRFLKMDKSKTE